jgi:hypothetical protein
LIITPAKKTAAIESSTKAVRKLLGRLFGRLLDPLFDPLLVRLLGVMGIDVVTEAEVLIAGYL